MRIAVLALQGAFAEHEQMLHRLGVETFEVRQLADWNQPKEGLIIPGGESTTQGKLLRDLGLFEPIRQAIIDGLPVFGTCAGLILLSPLHLGTMDIDVQRNAYGRQLGSFHTQAPVKGIGEDIPMTFIPEYTTFYDAAPEGDGGGEAYAYDDAGDMGATDFGSY